MGFSDTGRANENDVFPVVDKTEVQQPVDLPFVDGSLETVVKFFQAYVQSSRFYPG